MKNSVLEVDPKRYGRLLARKLPAVIRTDEENERLIAELEQFDRRHDEVTPEEQEYSELLTVLIEAFEDANYALEGSMSDSRLRSLMEEHGLRQRDLLDVFGSRGNWLPSLDAFRTFLAWPPLAIRAAFLRFQTFTLMPSSGATVAACQNAGPA